MFPIWNEVYFLLGLIQNYWFRFVRTIDDVQDEPQKNVRLWTFLYETVAAVASAVVILFVVFTFFARGVGVVGESMEPTLHDGDCLAVSVLSPVKHGDVVIVTQPNSIEKPIVKRVIAMGGEEVNIDFVSHVLTVGGKVLEEPYVAELTEKAGDVTFPLVVPEGQVFVLGGNRNNSMDSRFSGIGCIDEDYILGVAKYRVYPFSGLSDITIH